MLSRLLCASHNRSREKAPEKTIIKARQKRNDSEIIEKRKIAADDEKKLERNQQHAGNVPRRSRTERKPGHDQLGEVIPKRFKFVKPERGKMHIAADRARDWLRFIVIVETGEIAPAGVAAQFDQAGAKHDAKTEPAKKPNHQNRRSAFWKRPPIEQRTKKDRQETGLEQLDLPAVAVPDLADVNDRHVHRPKDRQQNCVRVPAENNERQRKSNPREDRQCIVGYSHPEERRHPQHPGALRPELCLNRV